MCVCICTYVYLYTIFPLYMLHNLCSVLCTTWVTWSLLGHCIDFILYTVYNVVFIILGGGGDWGWSIVELFLTHPPPSFYTCSISPSVYRIPTDATFKMLLQKTSLYLAVCIDWAVLHHTGAFALYFTHLHARRWICSAIQSRKRSNSSTVHREIWWWGVSYSLSHSLIHLRWRRSVLHIAEMFETIMRRRFMAIFAVAFARCLAI